MDLTTAKVLRVTEQNPELGPGIEDIEMAHKCSECGQERTFKLKRDTAAIFDKMGIVLPVYCEDCFQRRKSAKESVLTQHWNEICPEVYRGTDIDRLPKPARDILDKVVGWEYNSKGIFLIGPTMLGKTRLCYLLLAKLWAAGKKILRYDGYEFSEYCSKLFSSGGSAGHDWIRKIIHVDVLFIDDMMKIAHTPRVEKALYTVIDRRIQRRKPVIANTNCPGYEIERRLDKDLGPPLVSRLGENCFVYELIEDEGLENDGKVEMG